MRIGLGIDICVLWGAVHVETDMLICLFGVLTRTDTRLWILIDGRTCQRHLTKGASRAVHVTESDAHPTRTSHQVSQPPKTEHRDVRSGYMTDSGVANRAEKPITKMPDTPQPSNPPSRPSYQTQGRHWWPHLVTCSTSISVAVKAMAPPSTASPSRSLSPR